MAGILRLRRPPHTSGRSLLRDLLRDRDRLPRLLPEAESGAWSLRLRASGVAFAAMLLITTTYHLGYRDFRSSKIVMPNVGSTIGAVPTLVVANPVASVIGHAIMHVTSVVHSPGSDIFLPPHRGPERAEGRAAARRP